MNEEFEKLDEVPRQHRGLADWVRTLAKAKGVTEIEAYAGTAQKVMDDLDDLPWKDGATNDTAQAA